jgi:hypothetical protein
MLASSVVLGSGAAASIYRKFAARNGGAAGVEAKKKPPRLDARSGSFPERRV